MNILKLSEINTKKIQAIFRKDILELLRDGRVFILVGLVIPLAILTFWLSAEKVKSYELSRNLANSNDRETWLNQGPIGAHSAAHFSSWAYKPKTTLSIVDPGLSPYYGEAIWMEAHKQNLAIHREVEDSTEIVRFANLSPAWLTASFLPLLIIGFGFSCLAKEREGGQWKQMIVSGVSPKIILYGKAKLLFFLGLAISLAFTLPAIFSSLRLPNPNDGNIRWLLIIVTTILYSTAIISVTLAISAISKTTRSAFLALIGFWMFFIVLAPRFTGSIVEIVYPVPSNQIFLNNIEAEREENCKNGHEVKDVKNFEENILKKYGVKDKKDLPVNIDGFVLQKCEDYGNIVFDKYFGQLQAIHEKQQRLLRLAGIFSPVIAYRNATAVFSGGDVLHHWDFVNTAEKNRRETIKKLNNEMINEGKKQGMKYKLSSSSLEKIPVFSYNIPTWTISKWAILDLMILALWSVGGMYIAFFIIGRWRSF